MRTGTLLNVPSIMPGTQQTIYWMSGWIQYEWVWKAAETSVYFLANRVKISSFCLSIPLTKIWPIIESFYWLLYSTCIERGAWYRVVNNTDTVSPWTYHLVNVGSWISRRLSNVWAPSASSTAPHSHSTWDLNDGETCKTRDRKWWNEIKEHVSWGHVPPNSTTY